jgi:nitroimidazol reductase NimA-like FMN-containing flavoprotein (pyridoxamine 5'-phosphate oxidase superfamily)
MSVFDISRKNQVSRVPDRGHYDKETVYSIVDETLICHVGLMQNDEPVVIPTLHARDGDTILLHGATKSRLMQHVQAGHKICLTMTLLDGLVLARSLMHHSVNYRSAVLFGRGRLVPDEEKMAALKRFTDRLLPGRWDDARQPNAQELKATTVVAVPIDLGSAKIRVGPPGDDEEDISLPVWAGVIPMRQQFMSPQAAPDLSTDVPLPDYLTAFLTAKNGHDH